MSVSIVSTVSADLLTRPMILLVYSVLLAASRTPLGLLKFQHSEDLAVTQTSFAQEGNIRHRIAPHASNLRKASSSP